MAPSATTQEPKNGEKGANSASGGEQVAKKSALRIPDTTRERFEKAGIALDCGYPGEPTDFKYVQEAQEWGDRTLEYNDAGLRADPEKRELFGAATAVKHMTVHIGTEITGLQLKDLNDKQKDELALLVAERGVVFFRDQDLSPQEQEELGKYWGSLFPQGPFVPGHPNITTVWNDYLASKIRKPSYRQPFQGFHTDMVHEKHTPGYTHLHQDAAPEYGGDLLWASGYAAYSKLSPDFRKFLDGKQAVFMSREKFFDRDNEGQGQVHSVKQIHPIIRVHPVTGWKSLYVAYGWMSHIIGLDPKESDMILSYLKNVYENTVDIQVRFKFTPRSSVIWDNRVTLHSASWDYECASDRHGTRITTIGEKPYFDENAVSRRQALGLQDD